jgi:hypothetical protein
MAPFERRDPDLLGGNPNYPEAQVVRCLAQLKLLGVGKPFRERLGIAMQARISRIDED